MALRSNQAQAEARMRERSSVWFPRQFITKEGPGTFIQGRFQGRVQLLSQWGKTGEDHTAGITTHNPERKHTGREPLKKINGASKTRGFPKGISKQRAATGHSLG